MKSASVHIGTSGWHYKHWRGPFYPDKLPASKMLAFYTRHFRTVELNNTFYRLPQPNGLNNWRDSTPPDFCFAMKGSRFLTHMKKLKDPEPGIARFFERAELLGGEARSDCLSVAAALGSRRRKARRVPARTTHRTPLRIRTAQRDMAYA